MRSRHNRVALTCSVKIAASSVLRAQTAGFGVVNMSASHTLVEDTSLVGFNKTPNSILLLLFSLSVVRLVRLLEELTHLHMLLLSHLLFEVLDSAFPSILGLALDVGIEDLVVSVGFSSDGDSILTELDNLLVHVGGKVLSSADNGQGKREVHSSACLSDPLIEVISKHVLVGNGVHDGGDIAEESSKFSSGGADLLTVVLSG